MKKENKKMAWALGLVAGLGILAVAYATLTSTLNINAGAEVNVGGGVEFSVDGSGATTSSWYSVGDPTHGPYTSTKASDPTAIALGNGGTLAVSTDGTVSTADNNKLTISSISLREYDAYVVYQLNMENQGPTAMNLAAVPAITFSDPAGNTGGVDQSPYLSGGFFTDAACTTALSVSTYSAANCNHLEPGASTTWYLKVSRNARTSETVEQTTTYEALSSGLFDVSITPSWISATSQS